MGMTAPAIAKTQEKQIQKLQAQGLSRAEAEYKFATRKSKNPFGFLDPVLDIALGLANPILLALKKAGEAATEPRREAARAGRIETLRARVEAEQQQADEENAQQVEDDEFIPYGVDNDARLGGIPMAMLINLGAGLAQQTPAVRAMAAKASGRRGGKKSARKRKSAKKKAARAPRKSRKTKSAKKGRMVKGSAAAKAWGAKMKRARRK